METERFTAFIQIEQRGEYLLRQSGRHEYIAGGQPLDNPISKLPPQRVIFRQLPIILDLARLIARRYLAVYPIGLLQLLSYCLSFLRAEPVRYLRSEERRVGKEGVSP